MPSSFVLLILVVGVAILVGTIYSVRRDWGRRMGHIARTRGWRMETDVWRGARAVGEASGCRVEVSMPWRAPDHHDRHQGLAETLSRRNRKNPWQFTRVRVTFPRPMALKFAPEAGKLSRLLLGGDLELGDPTFDAAVRIGGKEAVLRAAFDAPTRWSVRLLVERGGACDGDGITLAWLHDRSTGRDTDGIDCVLDALGRLRAVEGTTIERLARIAGGDPKPGVRLGALGWLIERHGGAAETEAAVREALVDDDPAVRLMAALRVGDRAVLQALVAPGPAAAVRVRAVEALSESDEGLAFLRRVVSRLDGPTRAAAVAALKARGGIEVGGLALAETEGGGLALSEPASD